MWLAILVPAVLSSVSIWRRHQVEAGNKAATLAVELDSVQSLASAQGLDLASALTNLRAQGVSAVAMSEETLGELIARGDVVAVNKTEPRSPTDVWFRDGALFCRDPLQAARIQAALKVRFPLPASSIRPDEIPVRLADARQTPIGLDPALCALVRSLNLGIVARLSNPLGVTPQYIRFQVQAAAQNGAGIFLPQGDQVLGRRDLLGVLAETLKQNRMLYASPEFAKIGGDANVLEIAPELVVRLHAAQAAEIDKLPYADAVERYSKAARERNMRVLLLRPVTSAAEKPVNQLAKFVKDVGDQIRKDGGSVGMAKPFQSPDVPRPLFLLIGVSCAVAAAALALLSLKGPAQMALIAVYAGLGLLCWTATGRQLAALGASVLFPCLAYALLEKLRPKPVHGFLLVSLVSLVGGLCVAGLLNGLPFLIKAEEFKGIKVSVFLPAVLIGGFFFTKLADMKGSLAKPITWGAWAAAAGIGAFVLFILSRLGNDSPTGVSGTELAFRNLLDQFLYVRPRSKEFLIGHPALIVGITMLARLPRNPSLSGSAMGGWTALLLMVGALGSTSIVNTLCHLHTPIALSLARIAIGMLLGCILGVGISILVGKALKFGPLDAEPNEGG